MKLDVFNHIHPTSFIDQLEAFAPAYLIKAMRGITTLYDVEARLRHLEPFDDYHQILSAANPSIDDWAGPDHTPALARTLNEGLAAISKAHPDRFPGYIASLPMNNPEAALAEIDHAVRDGGASGIQIYSNIKGKPLDLPEFEPIFARMAALGRPIWLHPMRPPTHADYATEDISKFDIWWGFGWAYETSAAMARLAFSGIFERHPDLKIICHHWGAYAPHADGRMDQHWQHGITISPDAEPIWQNKTRSLRETFKMFYGDTAMFGGQAASQCGLEFFGADHSVFATDYPFDPEEGAFVIRETIAVIDSLTCSAEDRRKIYEEIPRSLLA